MPDLKPTRLPEQMSTERGDLDALLASVLQGHIGFVHEGAPVVIPSVVVQWGDQIITHGSTGSRWMRRVAAGIPVCVSIAAIDGLIVARSTVETAPIYRSAILFGSFRSLGAGDKLEALDALAERVIPGRTREVRRPTQKELAQTMLLAMPIDAWSVRILDRWAEDCDDDVAGPAWAGRIRFGEPSMSVVASPDLRPGTPVPDSLSAIAGVR